MALFAGTPLVMLAGVVAIAVGTRTEFMIGPATAAILGLGALCFASARSVTNKEARRNEPTFQALARRFDGAVARNLLGDCVLRIAHPRGRVEVEYCVYSFDGESHTPSTRFALTLPTGALPRVRRDMLTKPSAVKKLGPATRAEVEGSGGKVRLLGRGTTPSVEVWVVGWLDADEAALVLERSLPRLEALASRPWTA